MSVVQITPARAKKKTLEPMLGMLVEQKIDGQRYLIHDQRTATSRRVSVVTQQFVEKGDRVPHLLDNPLPPGTIVDCEFVSPADIVKVDLPGHLWDKCSVRLDYLPVFPHVSATTSVMGSLASEAIRKQIGCPIIAYAFDILYYNGKSTMRSSQAGRRKFLASLDLGPITLMPQWVNLTLDEQRELYELVTSVDGEGLIFKDPALPYNAASNWYKWKKDFPVDAVLTGNYDWGEGKLANLLGSVEIGVYQNGILQPVGNISAIMDGEDKLIALTAQRDSLRGLVVECRHNGKQNKPSAPLKFTLRHPRFRRWRNDDKNQEDCTVEALLAEIK